MSEPRWILRGTFEILHQAALAEHGGLNGMRDAGLLDSALARPRNLFAIENVSDIARLAACYAVGIARNHPFADGNKRMAFAAIGLFLALNGLRLDADRAKATLVMLDVAAGVMDEPNLAAWIRNQSRPRQVP